MTTTIEEYLNNLEKDIKDGLQKIEQYIQGCIRICKEETHDNNCN